MRRWFAGFKAVEGYDQKELGTAILLNLSDSVTERALILWGKNDFPFELKVMPVPKEIANGNTVEIRLTIQPTSNYRNAQYYLRYFQFDGQGTLQYYEEPPYLPNDLYPLQAKHLGSIILRTPLYRNPLTYGFRIILETKSN